MLAAQDINYADAFAGIQNVLAAFERLKAGSKGLTLDHVTWDSVIASIALCASTSVTTMTERMAAGFSWKCAPTAPCGVPRLCCPLTACVGRKLCIHNELLALIWVNTYPLAARSSPPTLMNRPKRLSLPCYSHHCAWEHAPDLQLCIRIGYN